MSGCLIQAVLGMLMSSDIERNSQKVDIVNGVFLFLCQSSLLLSEAKIFTFFPSLGQAIS
jgi:hypothetical protein